MDSVDAERAEPEEEHGGEDAAFSGFEKINAANVKDRIHQIDTDPDGADKLCVLKAWLRLTAEEMGFAF